MRTNRRLAEAASALPLPIPLGLVVTRQSFKHWGLCLGSSTKFGESTEYGDRAFIRLVWGALYVCVHEINEIRRKQAPR